MPKEDKDEVLLKEIRTRLKLAQENEAEVQNRTTFTEDTEFENGDQWDEKARSDREEVGRPIITVNKCAPVVKQILGDARQNKIQIKVKPVDNQGDPKVAKIFDGLINNIESVSSADNAYDTALGFAVRGGWGYFRVITKYSDAEAFDQDISIERIINPLSVYCDPKAQKLDRSDMGWGFILDTEDKEEHKKSYPDSKFASGIEGGLGDEEKTWIADKTIQVAEYFRIVYKPDTLYLMAEGRTIRKSSISKNNHEVIEEEVSPGQTQKYLLIGNDRYDIVKERDTKFPKVEWYKTNGIEILEGPTEFPCKYVPIIFVPGDEIWIEGKQILRSAIKWAKDPNRLYNWARSIAVETMASAPRQPWLLTADMIKGFKPMWETANRKPLPYLLYNKDASGAYPQRQGGTIPDGGANQEAAMSSDDIKSTTGIYDASLGARGNETSGKAIVARQRQGDIGTYVFTDNLVTALEHLGRILVDMIPRVFDTERVVRLLNIDGSEGWETINQTTIDPGSGEKIVLNDISIGKFDVVVTAGPSYSTKRVESAEQMLQLAERAPMFAPIIAPRIVKNLDFADAEDLAEEMKAMVSGPPPGQGEEQQPDPNQQIDMMNKTLTVEGKELTNTKKKMDIEAQTNDQDDRMKRLIVEALQDVGLVAQQAPDSPEQA